MRGLGTIINALAILVGGVLGILVVSYKNNGIVAICGLKDDSGTSIGE